VLNQRDVPRYLLDKDLLTPAELLDGGFVVRDVSSRNRNYRVETREGSGYLLKQAVGAEMFATVANEAAVYERLTLVDGQLGGFLPRYFGYDAEEGLLVLELIGDAEDLRSHHVATGQFSAGHAAQVGRALGLLHRLTRVDAAPAPERAAWILSIHRPDARIFRDISAAGLDLIRIVQQTPGFGAALDRVRDSWTPEALVHGDVKWDNCLIASADGAGEAVKLIDWEAAALGDPCWDIGSALSHYLSFWLFSIPVTGDILPARLPELAAYPLDSMKPALNACWGAYAGALGREGSEAEMRLASAVEHAGARLVQTAYEVSQLQQQVISSVVLHLQLAHNLLEQPLAAATRLLGINPALGHR
jgi:hypothetical protein